jgi:hypothetical protein
MRCVLPLSAVALVLSVAVAAAGPCGPHKRKHCVPPDTTVNLGGVSDISQKIVASEPAPAPAKLPPSGEPAPGYTGPTIGAAPMPGRAPTIGYKWSIE